MFPPSPSPQLLSRHSTSVNAQFSSTQFSRSVVSDSATPWIAARQASLSITNSQSLLKLMSIKSVIPSSHLILCQPLLLLPPTPPSIRVFSNESTLHIRWPKYWSFSFSISLSNEHPGLISFRMGWLDLLAVQGTSRVFSNTAVQNINSSVLSFLHSPTLTFIQVRAFSLVQFSHSVVSNSLWPRESQHARPPCPSPTPRDYSNLCLLTLTELQILVFGFRSFRIYLLIF